MPTVQCNVRTCTHWMPGSLCSAEKVDILMQDPRHMARSVDQTECKTFAIKSSVANLIGSMDNVNWRGMATEPFQEGTQLTPEVMCVIESCEFWMSHDRCRAHEIRVTGQDAHECQDTHCATYTQADG